jgi:hypothetical protein
MKDTVLAVGTSVPSSLVEGSYQGYEALILSRRRVSVLLIQFYCLGVGVLPGLYNCARISSSRNADTFRAAQAQSACWRLLKAGLGSVGFQLSATKLPPRSSRLHASRCTPYAPTWVTYSPSVNSWAAAGLISTTYS